MNIWLCKNNDLANVIVRSQELVNSTVGMLKDDIVFIYIDDYESGNFSIKKRYILDSDLQLINEEETFLEIDLPYSILYKTKSQNTLIKLTQKEKEFILRNELFVNLSISINEPQNKIIYGAPGTGKSHLLKEKSAELFSPGNVDRVTFYNGYTYGQFIGTFKPKPIYKNISTNKIHHDISTSEDEDHEPIITYEFIAGPFIELLVKALNNPLSDYCLIIEEINRTKVDAVFGNIFQLLDRDENGKSKYSINPSSELLQYLQSKLNKHIYLEIESNGLHIPKNFYLWATMNSADQGVFPMDTAFKRRWDFEYIGLNSNESDMDNLYINLGDNNLIGYNEFRHKLNIKLSTDFSIDEDRLLAPFFVNRRDFEEINIDGTDKSILKKEVFISKIVMYLKDDILRHSRRENIFAFDTFSEIVEKYPSESIIDINSF
ncbi:AAA family ATPase [Aliarcobacter cryaerophilus]|uniref:AAA family ATPase n=1 Tax=Aliarcobacter cryaerophilus TaxID=28198 RepID=UPI003DA2B9A0